MMDESLTPEELKALRDSIKWEDSQRDASRLANLVSSKCRRYGFPVDKDDALQEIALIWMICKRNFDPKFGATFRTYFSNAVMKAWPTVAKHHTDKATHNAMQIDSFFEGDGGTESLEIEDERAENPEREAIRSELIAQALERNPSLVPMLKLVESPPEELLKELVAARAQFDYAKSMGIAIDAPPVALTPKVISKIFGMNWRHRQALGKQLEKATRYV
jgi:hypothetical protein